MANMVHRLQVSNADIHLDKDWGVNITSGLAYYAIFKKLDSDSNGSELPLNAFNKIVLPFGVSVIDYKGQPFNHLKDRFDFQNVRDMIIRCSSIYWRYELVQTIVSSSTNLKSLILRSDILIVDLH